MSPFKRNSLYNEDGGSVIRLTILMAIISAVYAGVKFAPHYINNYSFEESIDVILEDLDGRRALDLSADWMADEVVRRADSLSLPVEKKDVDVRWDRAGGELRLGIDLSYPYTVKLFKSQKNFSFKVHKEKRIALDVAEERRRERKTREDKRRRKEEYAEKEAKSLEQCKRYGGEWNGRQCIITKYIIIP
ncbi:MAG: hypothetical protein V3W31_01155 [Thermodesulfobacteriota bacterium]